MHENRDFVVPVNILTPFAHAPFSWAARHTTVCLNSGLWPERGVAIACISTPYKKLANSSCSRKVKYGFGLVKTPVILPET